MSLSPRTRIGAYEILGPLGAGGMGEVYKARDTRLNRDVAIKALPQIFSVLPDRTARFEREAHLLASLNHPNIAGIYGVEELDGERYLALELVPGESLDKRLASGPMPVPDALDIARQIAEALEAAHEKGIVHRDLKPANVMLGPDGHVKVLDFGLAKALGPESAGSGEAAATITSPMTLTQAGIVIGTAAYMSPEQAKGRSVDKRTDVWAFGCVLYELLTGRRAFAGDDVAETIAAILRADPDWSALPPLAPAVAAMLRRCLERDPRKRIADMSTARFVLDHADVLSGSAVAHAVPAAPRGLARRLAPLAPLGIAIAAIAAFAFWRPAPARVRGPVTRFTITLAPGQMPAPARRVVAVSQDGTMLAYVADNKIFVRRLSDFEARPIAASGTGLNITSPSFSPDGMSIAFHSEGQIKRVPVAGGPAVTVCEVAIPTDLDWEDSGIVSGAGASGIFRCNPSGGSKEQLVRANPSEVLLSPQILPDGNDIVFASAQSDRAPRFETADIVVQSLKDGARRTLVRNATDPRITSNGYLVYASNGILYAARFDLKRLVVDGTATPLVEGVRRAGAETGTSQFAISGGGTLVYVPGTVGSSNVQARLAIADRTGAVRSLPAPAAEYEDVRVTRDGKRAAVSTDDGHTAIVWIYEVGGQAPMQRLTLRGRNRYPVWSPDGASIAFQSDRDGDPGIYRQRVDGTGTAERLTKPAAGEVHIPESWSPDGRYLAFAVRSGQPSSYSVAILSLADGKVSAFDDVRSGEPPEPVFSPDGRWIAYDSGTLGNISSPDNGVFVQPFPPTGAVYQAPRQLVDFHAVWSHDGKELIFIASSTAGQMTAIPITSEGAFAFGTPVRFPAVVTGERLSSQTRAFDILPDGRLIGIVPATEDGDRPRTEIRVLSNWPEALKEAGGR